VSQTPDRASKQQERFDEIVAAAARVFQRGGYEAATLEEVAQALGVRKATLYRYIGGKEDVLYSIIEDALVRMSAANHRWRDEAKDPLDRILLFLEDHVSFVIDNHAHVGVYFADLRVLPVARRRVLQALGDEYQQQLETLVREAMDTGLVDRASDPVLETHGLLGIVNYAYRWYRPGRGVARDRVVKDLPSLAVASLGVRAGSRSADLAGRA
jgi:TetR/AcrR family transcriptional regulator, cholesterol catabolism regulator